MYDCIRHGTQERAKIIVTEEREDAFCIECIKEIITNHGGLMEKIKCDSPENP